jgi:hypothetical protein
MSVAAGKRERDEDRTRTLGPRFGSASRSRKRNLVAQSGNLTVTDGAAYDEYLRAWMADTRCRRSSAS